MTWRQTPQGGKMSVTTPFLPPTTAMDSNSVSPAAMAVKNAVRSAQLLGPKAAFSMLQPR